MASHGHAPDEGDSSNKNPNEEAQIHVLKCVVCGAPSATCEELLQSQPDGLFKQVVYPYTLEVFDGREAWLYSCTNPADVRFDVVRVAAKPRPSTDADASNTPPLHVHGNLTNEHSWFPPYQWRFASCAGCTAHLGWCFFTPAHTSSHRAEEADDPSDASAAGDQTERTDVRPTDSTVASDMHRQHQSDEADFTPAAEGIEPQREFFGLIITRLRADTMAESTVDSIRQRCASQWSVPDPSSRAYDGRGIAVPLVSDEEDDAYEGEHESDTDSDIHRSPQVRFCKPCGFS